ncbi:hypothetical protein [Allohahella marinimesophila]|uniref:Chromosome segregation ATPase n=1 Tax=Allohahella marinimesophila TaxID=1054972 RepID=A0ABP7NHT9_9GAMM
MPDQPAHSQKFNFEIRRLVLVDSAGFCYVEIPVDQHALLLGSGNLGKSSLLNSLRLFLLPENNFRNSRLKFAFRNASAGSYYSKEESFQHYFPGMHSFLIMEVRNPVGTHCQILHRSQSQTRELGYGRIFIPAPYSELRPLFWDTAGDEEGIGRAVPGLSLRTLTEAAKKYSRDSIFTSDTARLRSMLYASEMMSQEAMRYCVLPLSDTDDRRVESLRTLILLLFEMSANDKAMAAAVASIVEADKKFTADALDFDIDQFLQRHEDLKAQNEGLTDVEKEQGRYERFHAAYHRYRELAQTQHEFAAFRDGLSAVLASTKTQRASLAETLGVRESEMKTLRQKVAELERSVQESAGAIRENERMQKQAESDLRDGEVLLSRYPGMRADQVEDTLKEERSELEQQLNALQNEAQAEEQRLRLSQKIRAQQTQLDALDLRIAGAEFQLGRQLDESVAAPLRAVEPRLLQASPGRLLEPEQLAQIEGFSKLFCAQASSESKKVFDWFDISFNGREPETENLQAQRKTLYLEQSNLKDQLEDLSDTGQSPNDRPRKIEKLKKALTSTQKDLVLLQRLAGAEVRLADIAAAIEKNRALQSAQEDALKTQLNDLQSCQSRLAADRAALDQVDTRQSGLFSLEQDLSNLQSRIRHLEQASAEAPLPAESINTEHFSQIRLQLEDFEQLRVAVLSHIREFAMVGVIDHGDGQRTQESPSSATIREAYQALETIFMELPARRELLRKQIQGHNETVASYRQALKANDEHIRRFERSLNKELEDVTINDLAEVRVDIHCHPKFRNLVEESAAIDPFSAELLSDAFYERLKVFVAEFFDANASGVSPARQHGYRLTMDRVITGISYRTRKESQTSLDRKGQSTSTTALINLELVQRLLRRVLYPGIRLEFPMVLDELASVDVSQVPALLHRLKQQGFNLFAAATHSASPELIYQIGRHFEIGQMRTARPYDKRRTLVFWGGAEGFTSEAEFGGWFSQEQSELLEQGIE